MKTKYARLLQVMMLASTLGLAGCGGGGGGGASTGASSAAPATNTDSNTTSPTIAAAGYAAGSPQAQIYTLVNNERVACGFGSISESTALDQAALAHANWLLVNNYTGHYESAGVPNGYTGVSPQDRGVAAGYTYATSSTSPVPNYVFYQSGEVYASEGATAYSPTVAVRQLLAAPYHVDVMMLGVRNIGIGYEDSNTAGTTATYGARTLVNIDFGVPAGATQQDLGSSDVMTYPCQGTTGTALQVYNESPDPVPGRDQTANPFGSAVLVAVRNGQTLAITSASMINASNGSVVTLLTPVTSANDPNGQLLSNEGYVLPNSPLSPNTQYQVTINGTNSGVAFSRSFTFTTGS
ncbi:MAG: CAP domain-containing protein [Burkholderiaceae bacterium]|nr:MAG: CAP domain-containing protein [Burkholderiaceae bacterium]TBR76818.1 MAG: CAP domain-containing protein [Burkholderiaceae bacterium]